MSAVKLTASLVEAFSGMYLSPRYDQAVATPAFHRECWAGYCADDPRVGCAAPREHAKSTSLTFAFGLACVCFRVKRYVIIGGSTEDMAAEQLSNLREELLYNDDLRRDFGVASFEQDSKTDIIVRCDDGHRFRILARGAEQKIRGKMWAGMRPDLFLGDDLEDDEQVANRDRRVKFRKWFFRAAVQALGRGGWARIHGTILHEDSLLARLNKNAAWKFKIYKAHNSFSDFTEILWPQAWPESRLRLRQKEFVEDGDSDGYSQEFLNDPTDNSVVYLRKGDFLPMTAEDLAAPKAILVGVDFAISKKDKANRTSFTVGGKCAANLIHVVDQYVGRWDSEEIIECFFDVQERHDPICFFVEDGQIWKAMSATIYKEMQKRDKWLNIQAITPISDKASRGRPYQKRHKSGGMRFLKTLDGRVDSPTNDWYPGYEAENLKFTGVSEATLDDQFDSTALLVKGFDLLPEVEEEDFESEDSQEMRRVDPRNSGGRSVVTGY